MHPNYPARNNGARPSRRRPGFPGLCPVLLLSAWTLALPVAAQDAVRTSLASAEAAAARRKAASTMGYYNLKLGPTGWRLGAVSEFKYHDNVYYRDDAESDFIISPGISSRMLWPVTDANSLNLVFDAGYSFYLLNTDLSRWYISPGSELSFDIYAGDFWINFHDRFAIEQDTYADPTVTGVGDYSRLENTAGVTTTWDLNKVVLSLNLDHVNYVQLSDTARYPDGQYELASIQAGLAVRPKMIVGTQLGGGYLQYSGQNVIFDNALQWSAGLFFDSPLTEYISVKASAGYTHYTPDSDVQGISEEDLSGIYADLAISHRLNEFLRYTLSGGRSIQLGSYSGSVDLYYARWYGTWRIIEDLDLGSSFSYETGEQFSGVLEKFDRYGLGLNLRRRLGEKIFSTLQYQFFLRDSRNTGNDYIANIVSLNFSYTF